MEASTLYNIETVVCPGVDELFARALEFMEFTLSEVMEPKTGIENPVNILRNKLAADTQRVCHRNRQQTKNK